MNIYTSEELALFEAARTFAQLHQRGSVLPDYLDTTDYAELMGEAEMDLTIAAIDWANSLESSNDR